MIQAADPDNGVETDPGVSAAYRAMAAERTPQQLDRTVLGRAAAATARPAWTQRWLGPAALAATVVLGISLSLRIGDEPRDGSTARDVDMPAGMPARERPPDAPLLPTTAGSGTGAADLSTAARDAGARLMELDRAVRSIVDSENADPAPKPVAGAGPAAGDAQRFCAEYPMQDADGWWRCIETLVTEGRIDDARSELLLFREHHPRFQP